ncbi:MAG: histone deacetylase [Rhodoferax sp.]|nr:histone deacetylase [Rhodoferax sp.]
MKVFYADHFVLALPAGHRFPMQKYAMLRERLAAQMPAIYLQEALPASIDALRMVHTPDYIDAVLNGTLGAAQQREIGFPWSPGMAERACRSVGGTILAARAALHGGMIAANLAGGTHHAHPERGSGFCVFNDVAVAARQMQREFASSHGTPSRRALQIAVIDLDVHQGDGTAAIFAGDESVFTLSLHGAKNFPVRKQTSDCDIELPDGCQDAHYLEALALGLGELERRFTPDLVFYLAGADPHEGDRLGRLAVTDAGMEARDRRVFDWALQRLVPVVMVMAGGYGRDIETTLRVQVNTYRVALHYWQLQHSRQTR